MKLREYCHEQKKQILMFLAASDSIEGISIKLGGFKTGVGFGVRF
jgi:hypothetical protein